MKPECKPPAASKARKEPANPAIGHKELKYTKAQGHRSGKQKSNAILCPDWRKIGNLQRTRQPHPCRPAVSH